MGTKNATLMGLFKRVGDRLLEQPEDAEGPKLRAWTQQVPGVEEISRCSPRQKNKVAGIVESIKLTPRPNCCLLEVEIYDGTDHITGVWYGRRRIPGVDLGRRLVLEGTICRVGDDLQIVNPAYELTF